MSTPDPTPGTIRPTPLRALAVALLFGALAGWLAVIIPPSLGGNPPRPPWSAPAALGVAAVVIGGLARATHQRIHVQRRRMDPQQAVSFLVLGKASALAGAVVVGGYLAFAIMFLGRLDAEAPRERVIRSAVAVVTGIALCIAGLLLERACKVPSGDDDDDQPRRGSERSRGEDGGRADDDRRDDRKLRRDRHVRTAGPRDPVG